MSIEDAVALRSAEAWLNAAEAGSISAENVEVVLERFDNDEAVLQFKERVARTSAIKAVLTEVHPARLHTGRPNGTSAYKVSEMSGAPETSIKNAEDDDSLSKDDYAARLRGQIQAYRLLAQNRGAEIQPSMLSPYISIRDASNCRDRASASDMLSKHIAANRVAFRVNELQNLPTIMPRDLKTRGLLELRGLRLLGFKKELERKVQEPTSI